MKGNLDPNPFAHLMPSERFSPPDRTESRYMTVVDGKGNEVELHYVGFGAMGEWMTREEERAHTAEIIARCDQRRSEEEQLRLSRANSWYTGDSSPESYVEPRSQEPTSAPVKVYREDIRGELATSVMGWIFFFIILIGGLVGIMSSL